MESDLIGRKLGPFELVEALGREGWIEVFQGFDSEHKRVLIKIAGREMRSDPVFNTRFRREARHIAELRHANIAPLWDFGEAEGGHYMVMEQVEGITLTDVLAEVSAGQRTLEPADIAFVTRQIAAALDHAHRNGVIHMDVRPEHVVLTRSGQAILTDFGLALLASRADRELEDAPPSAYIAPEQLADARAASPASDIYSLGVILYQLVTGELPFEAESDIDEALRHLHETAPDPRFLNPEVPASVAAVTLKALARSPGERFKNAMQLASTLERAYAHPDAGEAILAPRRRKPEPIPADGSAPAPRRAAEKPAPLTREERREQRRIRAEVQRAQRAERAARSRTLRRQFMAKWGRTVLVVAIMLLLMAALVAMLQTTGVLNIQVALPKLPALPLLGARAAAEEEATPTPEPTATLTPRPTATLIPTATALQAAGSTPVPPLAFAPLGPGSAAFRIADAQGMVFVPAGQFLMGTNGRDRSPSSKPQHAVTLSAYWIDRTEITNDQYRLCVDAGSCSPPSNRQYFDLPSYRNYPVTYVRYESAVAYCLWAASQTGQVIGLPTEAQWEKAAAWDPVEEAARTYPWGDAAPSPDLLRYNESNLSRAAAAVGSYPNGASAYGSYDMAGNVWEWVADWFDENYYKRTGVSLDPAGPISGWARVTRGGAWTRDARLALSTVRNPVPPATASNEIGFRCAMTAGRPPADSPIAASPLDLVRAFQALLTEARANPANDGPTLDEWEASLADLEEALTAIDQPTVAALIDERLARLETQRAGGLIGAPLALQLENGLAWILAQTGVIVEQ